MLNSEQVLKLIDAGFSADEVRGMFGAGETAEQPDTPEAEEQPDAAQDDAETSPEQPQTLTAEDVRNIVREQLKAAQQSANARTASRGGSEKPLTAEDVLRDLAKHF